MGDRRQVRIIVYKLMLMMLLAGCQLGVSQAYAHEFWIEPLAYRLGAGRALQAETRIGTMFGGSSYPYLPNWFISVQVTAGGKTLAIPGRHGDKPAITLKTPASGLNILTYHSEVSRLEYKNWEKFATFARKEGVPWVIDAHLQKGFPRKDFFEVYTRYGKSLVQVGAEPSTEADQLVGMPYELLVLTNPYQSETPEDISVQLWHNAAPQPGVQVSIFQKKQGEKKAQLRNTTYTDKNGMALIPHNGGGEYLISTVQIEEATAEIKKTTEALWHSHWASVTYILPEK